MRKQRVRIRDMLNNIPKRDNIKALLRKIRVFNAAAEYIRQPQFGFGIINSLL